MDSLSQIITHYQMKARVYSSPRVCGAWRINPTGMHAASFHLVAAGGCWLHLSRTGEPVRLEAGALIFLSRDLWHVLSPEARLDGDDTRIDVLADGPQTELICGSIDFGSPHAARLMSTLPDLVLLNGNDDEHPNRIKALGRLMAAEASGEDNGNQMVLDRLSDVLVVLVLRHAMASGLVQGGALAVLAYRRLSGALDAMHRTPGEHWTLEALAARAGVSRTAFAQRFAALMGETPMSYLAAWRMQLAEQHLRDQRLSVAQIAELLGYATEAAFRRAFKRVRGIAPGAIRRDGGAPDSRSPRLL